MRTKEPPARDIDEYISRFPSDVQETLQLIRLTIKKAVPEATEAISYQIPAFRLRGRYLIYFAGFKGHAGVYPAPVGNEELREELTPYASGKATVRFPFNQPVPVDLLTKIVAFRVKENLEKAEAIREKKRTRGRKAQ